MKAPKAHPPIRWQPDPLRAGWAWGPPENGFVRVVTDAFANQFHLAEPIFRGPEAAATGLAPLHELVLGRISQWAEELVQKVQNPPTPRSAVAALSSLATIAPQKVGEALKDHSGPAREILLSDASAMINRWYYGSVDAYVCLMWHTARPRFTAPFLFQVMAMSRLGYVKELQSAIDDWEKRGHLKELVAEIETLSGGEEHLSRIFGQLHNPAAMIRHVVDEQRYYGQRRLTLGGPIKPTSLFLALVKALPVPKLGLVQDAIAQWPEAQWREQMQQRVGLEERTRDKSMLSPMMMAP